MSIYNHQENADLVSKHFGEFFKRMKYDLCYQGNNFLDNNFMIKCYPGVFVDTYDGIQIGLHCNNTLLGKLRETQRDGTMVPIDQCGFYLEKDCMNITMVKGGNFKRLLKTDFEGSLFDASAKMNRLITKELGIDSRRYMFLLLSLMALHLGLSRVRMIHSNYTGAIQIVEPGALHADASMQHHFHLQEDDYGYVWSADEIIHYIAHMANDHRNKLFEGMQSLMEFSDRETGRRIFQEYIHQKYLGELMGLLREKHRDDPKKI